MTFPNSDRRRNLHEPIQDGSGRLRYGSRCTVREYLSARAGNRATTLRCFRGSSYDSERNRGAEDLQVVIVNFVSKTFFADLVNAMELIESTL
jgi:hypothetical protein